MITQRTDGIFISNNVFYFRNMLSGFKPVAGDTRQQTDNNRNNFPPIHKARFKKIILSFLSNR